MLKAILLMGVLFTSVHAEASLTLTKLAGNWSLNCAHNPAASLGGSMVETKTLTDSGQLQISREQHYDKTCVEASLQKMGTMTAGKQIAENNSSHSGT
jgi:hypothetical protein